MRVIGGSARGRQLAAFSGERIRPTPDRVREALFSMLYSRRGPFAGAKVLDLFAGSGALGIEALSRGAERAWFVDSSPQALATIRENLERCRLTARACIIPRDIRAAMAEVAAQGSYDLIFADPPYGKDLAPDILSECENRRLLAPKGILVLETAHRDLVPAQAGRLYRIEQRRYGLTMLHLFQETNEEPE